MSTPQGKSDQEVSISDDIVSNPPARRGGFLGKDTLAPAGGVDEAGRDIAAQKVGCVVMVRGNNYESLLSQYVGFMGQAEGESTLRDEYGAIVFESRKRAHQNWSRFYAQDDRATLFVESVDVAHALCGAMLDLLHEANARETLRAKRKQLLIGVATVPPPSRGPRGNAVEPTKLAIDQSNELVAQPGIDEVRLTEAAFAQLSNELQSVYGPCEIIGEDAIGEPVACHRRRRLADAEAIGNHRCIMSVDMSEFSRIQQQLATSLGSGRAAEQAEALSDQIQQIIKDGFRRARANHKKALLVSAGDGGLYAFDDIADAHRIAVQILLRAEEHNAEVRETNPLTASRCFRVGIAYGPVRAEGGREPSGPAITTAVRLESGGPSGEIRVTAEAYARLPEDLKKLYGGEEKVRGKKHDQVIRARRYQLTPCAPWNERGPDGNEYPPSQCPPPTANYDFIKPLPAEPVAPAGAAKDAPKALQECFVISPIDKHDPRIDDVFDNLIVPVARAAGYEPRRADQIEGPDRLDVITGHLNDAPMAIAYLGRPAPTWRQDVILEVGYRIAREKPLVLISEPPEPDADGEILSLTDLLPFHLRQTTVTEVPKQPGQAVAKLAREFRATLKKAAERKWTSPFPFMEIRFQNLDEDLTITEVSPEARRLFGEAYFAEGNSVEAMRASMKARIGEPQYGACRKHFRLILKELDARLGGFGDDEDQGAMLSGVPMIFKEEFDKPADQPRVGHLPVIVRHAVEGATKVLRIVYLPVSHSLKLTPKGYYVSEL
ncbi:MAG: hypothetical protein JWN40_1048 [Phycisphaerales bacterium]|nr:hypothetical protein [Phycisphaerales bacterium]